MSQSETISTEKHFAGCEIFVPPSLFPFARYSPWGNVAGLVALARAVEHALRAAENLPEGEPVVNMGELNHGSLMVAVKRPQEAANTMLREVEALNMRQFARAGYFCEAEIIWRPITPLPVWNADPLQAPFNPVAVALKVRAQNRQMAEYFNRVAK